MRLNRNVLIIAAAVAVCLVLLGVGLFINRGARVEESGEPLYMLLTVNDQTYGPVLLDKEGDYVVEQKETGVSNTIHMTKDGVFMLSATCDNQDCVKQGEVTRENRESRLLGNMIICLPNKVVVQLVTAEEFTGVINP